jgi:tetratricopeptide (TPR) repeat protein
MNQISKHKKYIFMFILIGLTVYFPGLLNGFVWDDFPFILANPAVHQLNLQTIIGQSVFNSGMFYRPIPSIYFAILYSLFGEQAFFYHLLQISLHIASTILLFFFFLRFFPKRLASFLSLLFLVHPINVESVAFIASTTSEIYFLFGMSAFMIGTEMQIKKRQLFAVFLLLLLATLTKETGFLFLIAILLYRYLFKLGKLTTFSLLGMLTGLIYFLLRVFVGGVTFLSSNPLIPIRELPFIERLVNIPAVVLYYLKTFIFPWDLSIWQLWVKTTTLQDFIIPLFLCLTILMVLLGYILYLHTKSSGSQKERQIQGIIFFTCWYIFGMALILQLVPLDMTVADRWFYFPIVGVLGIIGIGLQQFLSSTHKKIYVAVAVIIISIFSIRTFVRILDWKDNLTLYQHDIHVDSTNAILMDQLALLLYKEKRIDEALVYANKSVTLSPNYKNLNHLGTFYKSTKQYDKAISAFIRAIQAEESTQNNNIDPDSGLVAKTDVYLLEAYVKLADTYIIVGKNSEVIPLIENSLKRFPSDSRLYLYLAIAEYKEGNSQKALPAIKKSYELSPNKLNTYIYYRLRQGLPLE